MSYSDTMMFYEVLKMTVIVCTEVDKSNMISMQSCSGHDADSVTTGKDKVQSMLSIPKIQICFV